MKVATISPIATQIQNIADMDRKGRRANQRGVANGNAKLTESDIAAIRSAKGVMLKDLAEKFGVNRNHIREIRNGNRW